MCKYERRPQKEKEKVMKLRELFTEQMPDQQTLQKHVQNAQILKKQADAGNLDSDKALPMMLDMMKDFAKADIGSKMLDFWQKLSGAIKKGIDGNMYSPKDLPTMQKAYDDMMAQMPMMKQIAAQSRKDAVKYGGAGRQDYDGGQGSGSMPQGPDSKTVLTKKNYLEMSAANVAAVAMPMNGNTVQARNPDGTVKNALDQTANLLGIKKKKKTKKA